MRDARGLLVILAVVAALVASMVASAQQLPGGPLSATSPGGQADPATITGTGTAPDLAVFTGTHTIGNSAVTSVAGGTNCTTGTLALGVVGDPNTGVTHPSADDLITCTGGNNAVETDSAQRTAFGGNGNAGTDVRVSFDLNNGLPKVTATQTDNADALYQVCNGFVQCGTVAEGHSSGSYCGTGSFNMCVGNDAVSGAGDAATIIYSAGNFSAAHGGGAIRIFGPAVGRRITIDNTTGPSGGTTVLDGSGSKKLQLGGTTPISFPGVTSVAALMAETGDQEADIDAPFFNFVASPVAGCTATQGAAYSVAAPGTGGFAMCSDGSTGQPIMQVTNAGTTNSEWDADGKIKTPRVGNMAQDAYTTYTSHTTQTLTFNSADADAESFYASSTASVSDVTTSLGSIGDDATVAEVTTEAGTGKGDLVEVLGHLTSSQSASTTPVIQAGAPGGTCTARGLDAADTDNDFHIAATCTVGQTVIVTFGQAWRTNRPICTYAPTVTNAVLDLASGLSTTAAFTLTATAAGAAGAAGWDVHCEGRL